MVLPSCSTWLVLPCIRFFARNHLAAEGRANRLVPRQTPSSGNLPREMPDQFDADARFLRSAGSGRNHNALRGHRLDLSDGHFVVAANLNLGAQFPRYWTRLLSERIVVIEDEDHRFIVAVKDRFQGFKVSKKRAADRDVQALTKP